MSAWTDLGGGVRVRTSRLFQMNSAVLLDREHAIVVDPGILPSELDALRDAVAEVRPARVTLFLTHADWDHVLGRPWWPDADVLAHDRFAGAVRRRAPDIEAEAARAAAAHGERFAARFAPFAPTVPVSGLRFTRLGPWRTVFRDAYGHSDSQLSLHLPERRILFAADMLSDIEVPALASPPRRHLDTLDVLEPLVRHGAIETLVPGHGTIAHGAEVAERLRRDRAYLETLEHGARAVREAGGDLEAAQRALEATDDVERHPEFPMREIHRDNVQHAYEGAAATER